MYIVIYVYCAHDYCTFMYLYISCRLMFRQLRAPDYTEANDDSIRPPQVTFKCVCLF